MANRMKEDERNEKIIRGLLKLPANRRCINCNSLGPQYVCTNFWTFICTNCSGMHREFTHRVKSVSMAKFTSQEVNALQEGGNERAREIYFKEWDPQRHSFPDSSNVDRLRDFIKHVYVDRRYTGERSVDRPPRVKGEREDSYENRRSDTYRGGSRSPSYDETYDRRYVDRPASGGRNDDRNSRSTYEERRSPGYDQVGFRSPGRFDTVDERGRDDRYGNGNQNRRLEDSRLPDVVPRPEGKSGSYQKESEMSSPPMVRPVREILGEDVPPLRVGEPPRSNGTRVADGPVQTQRTTSSNSLASTESNPAELKRVNSGSLIDFNANPEPPAAAAPPQPVPQPTNSPTNSGDWASFDSVPQQKAPQAASNISSLESALAQLSVPVGPPSSTVPTLPNAHANLFSLTNDVGQGPTGQQNHPSLFPATQTQSSVMHSTVQPFSHPSVVSPNGQPWASSSFVPNVQLPLTTPSGQPSQTAVKPQAETNVGVSSQPPIEAKPRGRMELPADLFTASYSSPSLPGWQTGPHLHMGYVVQYPSSVAMPPFPQPSKSTNPFDASNEPALAHAPSFPSMTSLQGALPNMANLPALMRSSSFEASPSPRWVAPQLPSYPSAIPPSGFVMQQAPSNIPQQAPGNLLSPGHQQLGGFGGPAFGVSTADQHLTARYSQPGAPNFPSVSGNPFG